MALDKTPTHIKRPAPTGPKSIPDKTAKENESGQRNTLNEIMPISQFSALN